MNRSNPSPRIFSADQLHAALRDVGGAGRADHLHDIVAAAGHIRQRPGWTFLGGWRSAEPAGRRQDVPRVAVALLLVAAVVEAVVYVGSRPQPMLLPTTSNAWERVEIVTPAVTGRVASFAVGPRGLVAMVGGDEPTHLAVSDDGRTWTVVPDDQLPGFSDDRSFGMPSLLATKDGLLMLQLNEVWSSEDGQHWQRLASGVWDPDLRTHGPDVATVGGPGLVGVGDDKAWYSVDGSDWSTAVVPPLPAGIVEDNVRMTGVTATGNDLVAWGIAEVPTSNDPREDLTFPMLWASRDGRTWRDVVASGMDSVTAVAGGPGGFVATGRAGSEAAVWRSADGTTWERVDDDAFADPVDLHLGAAAATSTGYVVVGATGTCLRTTCPDQDVVIWTSADGRSWSRVASADFLTGAKAYGAFAWGSGFVLGGAADGKPAIWFSDPHP